VDGAVVPSLTIGGQVREIRLTATDLDQAERQILKAGGRPIMAVLGNHGGLFAKYELEWLLWGAWRHTLSSERLAILLAQFYAEGGTLFDVQSEVIEAIIDSGLYGRRTTPGEAAPPLDPPQARASA
jgi:hypothetical protein